MNVQEIIKRYAFVVQWSDEDQLWLAACPDLLGPFSRIHGDTPQEAITAIIDMAEFYVEDELTDHPDGSSLPPPSEGH